MRRSRLSWSIQQRLIEHFVSGSTARTAASLVGVNKSTAAFYFHRLREIIADRRANPRADFINDLVTARDRGDKLTDRELFDQIFTICGAALSATTTAIGSPT